MIDHRSELTMEFNSLIELNKIIEKTNGIPCRECLVRATCYDEFESDNGKAYITIEKSCIELHGWIIRYTAIAAKNKKSLQK